jgi:hypothetical protein
MDTGYGQVLHMNGMIPSRVSQQKMAKREIMWSDWDSNPVWCRENSTDVWWYYVNTSGPHLCSCSVRNVIRTWAWFSLVTELCILCFAVPVDMCMVAWMWSKWSPKNMVYEHRLRRNQEPNNQIFDTVKCVSQVSTDGIVTSYRLHDQGFKSWQGQQIFLFLKPVHIGSRVHSASYSIGIRCSGKSGWIMRLTIHLQHVQDWVEIQLLFSSYMPSWWGQWRLDLCKMREWTWCSSDVTRSMVTGVRMSIQT